MVRLIDKHAAQPIRRWHIFWNTGRMHVKTFCAMRKHPRRRPLFWPKADLRKNAFIAPDKFAKGSAVTLRMNFSWKNFKPWNPSLFYLALAPVRSGKFTCGEAAF